MAGHHALNAKPFLLLSVLISVEREERKLMPGFIVFLVGALASLIGPLIAIFLLVGMIGYIELTNTGGWNAIGLIVLGALGFAVGIGLGHTVYWFSSYAALIVMVVRGKGYDRMRAIISLICMGSIHIGFFALAVIMVGAMGATSFGAFVIEVFCLMHVTMVSIAFAITLIPAWNVNPKPLTIAFWSVFGGLVMVMFALLIVLFLVGSMWDALWAIYLVMWLVVPFIVICCCIAAHIVTLVRLRKKQETPVKKAPPKPSDKYKVTT